MVRKTRKMPALISTIALIAGCGSSTRAEVTGVVVDARTGRAIPGARVVAHDGSATRTDDEGRFTLSVSRGDARSIRASAAGREDAQTRIDVGVDESASIVIRLVPAHDETPRAEHVVAQYHEEHGTDPDAVLRWIEDVDLERWLVRGVREPEGVETVPCGTCTAWGAREQWALGAMRLAGDTSDGAECASCHDASAFAAAHGETTSIAGDACVACHEGTELRAFEHVDHVAGAPASGLGTGAVCVECHRAPGHAPQADVVLGRGARTLASADVGEAPHGAIADACVACHAAPWREADPAELTLGHTFEVREASGGIARDACSSCHGEVAPESIARGDWDGDGASGAVAEEHDRAVARVRRRLESRVQQARVRARCGTRSSTAVAFTEHAAGGGPGTLVLVDVRGVMLGDCDEDGAFDEDERPVSIDALPRDVRDSMWDLMLLERDGSRGVHNPTFSFALLGAIEARL
ncbi:carboxypeptidase-like regulatory domain-containing protein [Sandaracinus amylolyticus]|uniref:Uncharacterized protein n=1 Tax=Sandaracinus amylolyticus TaxID=927083 RepID=A0A0F6YH79_9BACT|nr:carboxypeptidase-like regulatory domain-containing protein [Sandaracinus amylolyticus]AKF04732.1 hypothetical protein DB32_001881 [Sandaracinus amylolyticus]